MMRLILAAKLGLTTDYRGSSTLSLKEPISKGCSLDDTTQHDTVERPQKRRHTSTDYADPEDRYRMPESIDLESTIVVQSGSSVLEDPESAALPSDEMQNCPEDRDQYTQGIHERPNFYFSMSVAQQILEDLEGITELLRDVGSNSLASDIRKWELGLSMQIEVHQSLESGA
jgi:hypothetical protein